MDETKKKILIGAGLIVFAILGVFGLYYFFFRIAPPPIAEAPKEAAPVEEKPRRPGLREAQPAAPIPVTTVAPTPEAERPSAALPFPPAPLPSPIATGGLTTIATLTEQPATLPALATNGQDVVYYNRDEGTFSRVTPEGRATPLTPQAFPDVASVAWAPSANTAILEFPDGANVFYNFETKQQTTLPKHWTDFSFAPNSESIAFKAMGLDPEDRWLAVANPDGSGVVPIAALGKNADKVDVSWSPNQQMVATMRQSRDGFRQELFFIGKNEENFRLALLEGRQFVGQWTPKGDRMLYSVASPLSDLKPALWIVDAAPGTSGENRQYLALETWADKCTIASDNRTAYCAVPRTLPRGAGLVRDIAKDVPDDFYTLDTTTGAATLLATPADNDVTAANLMLSKDGENLFFTDTTTGALKKIQLK